MACGRFHDHYQVFISQECNDVRLKYSEKLQEVSALFEEAMQKYVQHEDFIEICAEIKARIGSSKGIIGARDLNKDAKALRNLNKSATNL